MCRYFKQLSIFTIVALYSLACLPLVFSTSESIAAPPQKGWTSLFSDSNYGGPNGVVNSVLEYNNALIVAGEFSSVGGLLTGTTDTNNIAAFDGSMWHAIDNGITGEEAVIHAMAVYDGDLIVAGKFETAGSTAANNIAKWNSWTAGWEPLGLGLGGDDYSEVYALYVFDGELYAGGSFSEAGTITTDNIAKWDGEDWHAVGSGRPGMVYCFTEWDGMLVAGGGFTAAYPTSSIAYLVDGTYWRNFGFVAVVRSLTTIDYEDQEGVLMAGGQSFPSPDTVEGNLWYYNSGDWLEFEGGIGREDTYTAKVNQVLFYDDKVIVTGDFHRVGEEELYIDGIAYWQKKWNKLGDGLGAEGIALFVDENKKTLYVGGDIWYTDDILTENLGQYIFRTTPPGR